MLLRRSLLLLSIAILPVLSADETSALTVTGMPSILTGLDFNTVGIHVRVTNHDLTEQFLQYVINELAKENIINDKSNYKPFGTDKTSFLEVDFVSDQGPVRDNGKAFYIAKIMLVEEVSPVNNPGIKLRAPVWQGGQKVDVVEYQKLDDMMKKDLVKLLSEFIYDYQRANPVKKQ